MKKRSLLRFIPFILAAVMLVGTFASCSDNNPEAADTTAAIADTKPAVTEEITEDLYDANGYLKDNIPADLTFGGITLRELIWSDDSSPEFGITETNGDLVKDSIFNRNMRVEERLGVAFEEIGQPGNNGNREAFLNHAMTAASGGDNYDIYGAYSMSTALIAYNGLCRNMLDYSVLDFDMPWWSDSLIEEATINGRLYFASGDISPSVLYQMYCVFFNKSLIADYKLENPYECVENNSWTYDKLFSMGAEVGNTNEGADRMYSVCFASTVYVDPFFFAAGMRTTETADDGSLVVADSFHDDFTEQVASEVWEYLHAGTVKLDDSKGAAFATGTSLFEVGTVNFAPNYFSKIDFEYGVVPVPKYSADQEKYKSCIGFAYTLYAISTTSPNPEASAAAIECLASEGYRQITPALFEITMKARYASDAEATKSFDIIRENASFDVGRIFTSSLDNLTYKIFRGNITGATKISYLTQYKAQQKVLAGKLQALNDKFAEIAASGQ